jgi:CRP-like cAMP-binding protein
MSAFATREGSTARLEPLRVTNMSDASEPGLADLIGSSALRSICREVRFEPGAVLRVAGRHYRDMFLITSGRLDVALGQRGAAKPVQAGPGSAIGEIGFLRGTAAVATVTTTTSTDALVIDDAAMARLEHEQPAMTAQLLRHLAEVAEERTSFNLVQTSPLRAYRSGATIEVHLCRNGEMLERAQRLRYQVYCDELGRKSPYADHDRRIIADYLDATGNTFIAAIGGEAIGTLRSNIAADGGLGIVEELYGMNKSRSHPDATAICTKFIVRKSNRGGPASFKLIAAMVRFGIQRRIRECYIDCIPALLPYYKAIGFSITGERFLHPENGPSHPMMLDLEKHAGNLSREIGVRDKLVLVVKVKALKWIERIRRPTRLRARG